MARSIVFTKEQILKRTSKFIKTKGIEALDARTLCKYIGCSTQPLFKNFENMEGLRKEIKKYLYDYYNDFVNEVVDMQDYLLTINYAYALFAFRESNIFKTLFMSDVSGSRTIHEMLTSAHINATIEFIQKQYGTTKKQAEKLYNDVHFYTHGLACQIACHSIVLNERDMRNSIDDVIEKLKKCII